MALATLSTLSPASLAVAFSIALVLWLLASEELDARRTGRVPGRPEVSDAGPDGPTLPRVSAEV